MRNMAERTYRWLFWVLAVGGTLLDQATKYGVYRWLYHGSREGTWPANPRIFWLHANYNLDPEAHYSGPLARLAELNGPVPPYLNPGALFGLGQGYNGLFSVISVLAAVGIIAWVCRRSAARDWVLCTSLGLILAGTLGNLYDRVVFSGVRDFLHFQVVGVIDWPIFNLADSCLVCGALLLLLQAFWTRSPAPAPQAAAGARAPELAAAKKD